MVTLLSVKGLHSSVDIMGCIDKYMLATEVDECSSRFLSAL